MNQEAVCPCPSNAVIKTESLSFGNIPQQSRLFVQYQQDPLSLRKFYPNAIESHTQISKRIPEVLENYKITRSGIITESKDFISNKNFIFLKEKLSVEDEKRVKDLIKSQLKVLLWNLYTKNSILV